MRMNTYTPSTEKVVLGLWLILWVGAIGGWVANIVKLVSVINEPITGMFILRAIGIVAAPLGIVLGYV